MTRELTGWLYEVIKAIKSRKTIIKTRDRPIYDFKESIIKKKKEGFNPIIAEFKKSSPSGFKQERNPIEYAKFMESSGVAGLSILTEPVYFSGSYDVFDAIAKIVKIPLLFKDFVVTEDQIHTAYSIGADAVLLIVRILKENELCNLYEVIKGYKMTPLVEIENENDLKIAASYCGVDTIGINARDLNSLNVKVEKVIELMKLAPARSLKIAESGINKRSQIFQLRKNGADAFLIGTALMKDPYKIKFFI